jgi:hypothetical protein
MLEFEAITAESIPDIKKRIKAYNKLIIAGIYNRRRTNAIDIKYLNLEDYIVKKIKTGEIVYPFVRKYLEGQISTARKALALAILTILPVKALWPFEIVFWSIYFYYVKKYKNEALEYDRKKLARIFKSEN